LWKPPNPARLSGRKTRSRGLVVAHASEVDTRVLIARKATEVDGQDGVPNLFGDTEPASDIEIQASSR
jgi:hypothetical protein